MSNYCADVMIHIDENLDDDNIHEIEQELGVLQGVACACVPEQARHLLLIDYDPVDINAQALLSHVTRHGVHAELVGL